MTVVAKLGSSIVADDGGELRAAVLDSVCAQVAELHDGGENVVLVTSGAIARGMRLMGLDGARARSTRCRRRRRSARARCFAPTRSGSPPQGVHAAQVLLTSFDMSARMHYLNARQTLRRLLDWRAVPVMNENDTTATDEITFGDNDFLSAQVAILLEARLLVLLTDTAGLTPPTRAGADAELVEEVRLRRARRATRSAIGPRHSARAGCGARSRRPRWRAPPGSRS